MLQKECSVFLWLFWASVLGVPDAEGCLAGGSRAVAAGGPRRGAFLRARRAAVARARGAAAARKANRWAARSSGRSCTDARGVSSFIQHPATCATALGRTAYGESGGSHAVELLITSPLLLLCHSTAARRASRQFIGGGQFLAAPLRCSCCLRSAVGG